ncbi:MAG: hypothetical protein KQI35_08470 [Bacteroidetes bacterium]|nr:hypothetical protein [Bacteroidota bacterium]
MKTQKYIYVLGFILTFAFAGYAQQKQVSDRPELDPKLTLEEQLQILKGSSTPARPVMEQDERQLKELGVTEMKIELAPVDAQPVEDREVVLPPQPMVQTTPAKENTQPAGEVSENVINYRQLETNPQQDEGQAAEKVINYREIKGSPDQPEGEKPDAVTNYRQLPKSNDPSTGNKPPQ